MGKFGKNIKRVIAALIALTLLTHLVIMFNVKKKEVKQKKLVRDHEEALCNFRLHKTETSEYRKRQECPKTGIVTVFYAGGLHSHMWSYASVWAVSKLTQLTPFIPLCMYNFLLKVFEDLNIPPLTSISECDVPLPNAAQSYESWSGGNESIVLPIFSSLSELALPRLKDLIREFRIKENLLEKGEKILGEYSRRKKLENPVYVGVHLPRHWQSFANGLLYPETEFYRAVFREIRKRKNDTVFAIVADDGLDQFTGNDLLFVNGTESFGLDLAVLSLCNMSVLGFDGIGIWGAILSRGETFVFDESEGKFEEYLRLIPNWKVFG